MLGLIVHYCKNTAQVGRGGQGLILHLIPGAGQAIGHGELLRTLSKRVSTGADGKS